MRALRTLPRGVWFLAVLAVGWSAWVRQAAYLDRPLTTDENAYVFQAECFLDRVVSRPLPQPPDRFEHPMLIMDEKAGWLSRYSPGHALWLLPGVALGLPELMPHVGAGISLILLALFARREGLSPVTMAVLLILSPFYAFMHASLLSHTSALVCTSGLLLAHQDWRKYGGRRGPVWMGLLWALLFLNRTYTAALLALPFGVDACLRLWGDWRNRERWVQTVLFAGCAVLGPALYKGYNKLATGSSRMSTYLLYDPSEGLGFGPRHTRGLAVEHSWTRGVENMLENVVALDQWLLGWPGGLAVCAGLWLLGWRRGLSPLLLAVPVVVLAGYVAFWFPGIEHFRPVYSFELLPFWLAGGLTGVSRIHGRLPQAWRRPLSTVLFAVLAAASLRFQMREAEGFRERNRESARVQALRETLPDGSLLFLRGLGPDAMHESMLNPRGVDSRVVTMRGRGLTDVLAARMYPEREARVLTGPEPHRLEKLKMPEQVLLEWPAATTGRLTGSDFGGEEGRRTAREGDGAGFLSFGRYFPLGPGVWELRCRLEARDAAGARLELAADKGREMVETVSLADIDGKREVAVRLRLTEWKTLEPRIWYGGKGRLEVIGFELEEVDAL